MNMWELASTSYAKVTGESASFFRDHFNIDNLSGSFKELMTSTVNRIRKTDAYVQTLHTSRKLRYADGANEIRQYSDIEQFQFANEANQRFLVANPAYRKLYNKNRAAGFEDGFSTFDRFRGTAYAHTDANYREITSGLSTDYDEKYVNTWDLAESTKSITNVDRIDTFINWSRVGEMDWEDSDPHSEYGAAAE